MSAAPRTFEAIEPVSETTRCALDMKVLIEQMREQVQNVE